MTDTRKLLSDAIDRWERWAAGEMFIAEHLHPRARARLMSEIMIAICEDDIKNAPVSKPKGKKAGA